MKSSSLRLRLERNCGNFKEYPQEGRKKYAIANSQKVHPETSLSNERVIQQRQDDDRGYHLRRVDPDNLGHGSEEYPDKDWVNHHSPETEINGACSVKRIRFILTGKIELSISDTFFAVEQLEHPFWPFKKRQ